jgi:hypothetical protein
MKSLFVILAFVTLFPIVVISANYDIYYSKKGVANSERFDYALNKLNSGIKNAGLHAYKPNTKLSKHSIYIGLSSSINNETLGINSSKVVDIFAEKWLCYNN